MPDSSVKYKSTSWSRALKTSAENLEILWAPLTDVTKKTQAKERNNVIAKQELLRSAAIESHNRQLESDDIASKGEVICLAGSVSRIFGVGLMRLFRTLNFGFNRNHPEDAKRIRNSSKSPKSKKTRRMKRTTALFFPTKQCSSHLHRFGHPIVNEKDEL